MDKFEFRDPKHDIMVVRAVLPTFESPLDPERPSDEVLGLHRHNRHTRHNNQTELLGGQIDPLTDDPFSAVIDEIYSKTQIEVEFKDKELSCIEYRVMENGGLYIACAGVVRWRAGREIVLDKDYDEKAWINIRNLSAHPLTDQAKVTLELYMEGTLGITDIAGPNLIPDLDKS